MNEEERIVNSDFPLLNKSLYSKVLLLQIVQNPDSLKQDYCKLINTI